MSGNPNSITASAMFFSLSKPGEVTNWILSWYCRATCATVGASARHGPHHGAQNQIATSFPSRSPPSTCPPPSFGALNAKTSAPVAGFDAELGVGDPNLTEPGELSFPAHEASATTTSGRMMAALPLLSVTLDRRPVESGEHTDQRHEEPGPVAGYEKDSHRNQKPAPDTFDPQ